MTITEFGTVYFNYDFNSHAHVERDDKISLSPMSVQKISTHTLTWSVTCRTSRSQDYHNISTHTLTWSVTDPLTEDGKVTRISTHTLTWSVTVF